MRALILLSIFCAVLISACKVEQGQSQVNFDFEQFFNQVKQVNNCVGQNEGFTELANRIESEIQPLFDNINEPTILKSLYYEGHKRQTDPNKPARDPRCSDLDVLVKDRAIRRLGAIGTSEAKTILIDLYKDADLPFLGSEAMTLSKVLSEGGEEILKAIEPIAQQRPLIGPKVVNSIKTGQKLY